MKELIQKKWFRTGCLVAVTIGIVYGMIYWDVVSRARESFKEGEKYWAWHHDPGLKRAFLEKKRDTELRELEKKLSRGAIDKNQYEQEKEIISFSFREAFEESSIKYAYVWYQTAVELFTPPESIWVKRSREKMQIAKEMWKEELRAKNIPFEDYMIE